MNLKRHYVIELGYLRKQFNLNYRQLAEGVGNKTNCTYLNMARGLTFAEGDDQLFPYDQSLLVAVQFPLAAPYLAKKTMNSSSTKRKGKGHRFPYKLHAMLDGAEESLYVPIVSWNADGRSFTIHDRDALMQQVAPLYFQQTHFRSFVSKECCILSLCCSRCS